MKKSTLALRIVALGLVIAACSGMLLAEEALPELVSTAPTLPYSDFPQALPSLPMPAPGTAHMTLPATLPRRPTLPLQAPASPVNPNELRITGLGSSSMPWTIVVLLTVLTLIPSLLLCMTPFSRLLVVFHFLRQALGLQSTPTNQTLIGLSIALTFFLMQPVGLKVYDNSVLPLQNGKVTAMQAVELAGTPVRQFMEHYVREKDVALFLELAKEPRPRNSESIPFRVLVPAYIVSELKTGFQIGAILFLPFLVIDMVVASITTSVGMLQLPPVVISAPLKLMLFVMVDGWNLLIGSLMKSFA